MRRTMAVVWVIALTLTVPVLLVSRAGEVGMTIESSPSSSFQVCQTSGPSFDLTLMPGFVDLVPGSEPVTLILELRVEVTDPDGVSVVIGSYKNESSSEWTNVTMLEDLSTGIPDDYVAEPLNYTMVGTNWLVIWYVIFHANDSLGNWNTSDLHKMSVCRQGLARQDSSTTPNNTIDITAITVVAPAAALVVGITSLLYMISRHRRCPPVLTFSVLRAALEFAKPW